MPFNDNIKLRMSRQRNKNLRPQQCMRKLIGRDCLTSAQVALPGKHAYTVSCKQATEFLFCILYEKAQR
jgi:hypothetical protein